MEDLLTMPVNDLLGRAVTAADKMARYSSGGIYLNNNAQLAMLLGQEEKDETLNAMTELNEQTLNGISDSYSKAHSQDDKYDVSQLSVLLTQIVQANPNIFKGDFKISAWQTD